MKKIFTFAIALVCAMAANAAEPAKGTAVLSGSPTELTPLVVTAGKSVKAYMWIDIQEEQDFAGLEAELYVPEGVTVVGAKESTLTTGEDEFGEAYATHTIEKPALKDGYYKVLIYSGSNTPLGGKKGSIAQINLSVAAGFVGGEAQFKNVIFACITSPNPFDTTKGVDSEKFVVAETTGINDVNAKGIDVNAPMYNMQGVQVKSATKGVFIQNGKKYIVK